MLGGRGDEGRGALGQQQHPGEVVGGVGAGRDGKGKVAGLSAWG